MMTLLTDLGIRRAKPKESVYSLNDGRGLSLRIEPNGAKLWHFRFYWQGKQQRVSFGSFPEIDLKAARQRREDTQVLIANGIDPRVQQVEDDGSCQGITFAEFAEHWKNFKLKKLGVDTFKNRQSTRVQIERYLRKDPLPVLGTLPLSSISQKEILIVFPLIFNPISNRFSIGIYFSIILSNWLTIIIFYFVLMWFCSSISL